MIHAIGGLHEQEAKVFQTSALIGRQAGGLHHAGEVMHADHVRASEGRERPSFLFKPCRALRIILVRSNRPRIAARATTTPLGEHTAPPEHKWPRASAEIAKFAQNVNQPSNR